MGAIQAQDYAMAKWAPGIRLTDTAETKIEQSIDKGEIIRAHVLRPECNTGFKACQGDRKRDLFPPIVVNGKVVGTWKRTVKRDSVLIRLNFINSSAKNLSKDVVSEVKRYGRFLGMESELSDNCD